MSPWCDIIINDVINLDSRPLQWSWCWRIIQWTYVCNVKILHFGILNYALTLVHVLREQIFLVWVDEIISWELLFTISCSTRQKTNEGRKPWRTILKLNLHATQWCFTMWKGRRAQKKLRKESRPGTRSRGSKMVRIWVVIINDNIKH